MNPKCAKCEKTVYPVEKLNCLDKFWHKACFRCDTCNLGLSMKTYKGYNGIPYCNTHYPTTKFTAIADTPENRRLAKISNQQSNIEYHKDFEAKKGQYQSVADDPETMRAKKVSQQSSNIAYQQQAQVASRDDDRRMSNEPETRQYNPPPPSEVPPPQPAGDNAKHALYDYAAADDDEVSFQEGDLIVDVQVIDEGWCEGTVQRTGEHGMMPSNYLG